jgi:hypothetical protein
MESHSAVAEWRLKVEYPWKLGDKGELPLRVEEI